MTSPGHVPLWHRVLDEDGDEDTPDTLEAAVRDEIASLWTDLEHAMDFAHNGQWSVGCDNLAGRIVRLSRVAGAVPWQNVPFKVMLDGTYQGLLTGAGIEHVEPGEDDLRKMREWLDGQRAAVRGPEGTERAALPPVLTLSIKVPGLGAIPVQLAGAGKPPSDDARGLLSDAERALTASFKSALTVQTSLTAPYPDSPQQTPWSQFMERPARNAHNTAMRIRKFLRDNPEAPTVSP